MTKKRIAIIGGGPAAMSAAAYAQEHVETLLFIYFSFGVSFFKNLYIFRILRSILGSRRSFMTAASFAYRLIKKGQGPIASPDLSSIIKQRNT